VHLDEMGYTAELLYLRSLLQASCLIVGSDIYLNTFELTTDLGAGGSEDAWYVCAVTGQKPTLQRQLSLDSGSDGRYQLSLTTIDLMKLVAEMTTIPELWSLQGGGEQEGMSKDGDVWFWNWSLNTHRQIHQVTDTELVRMRS